MDSAQAGQRLHPGVAQVAEGGRVERISVENEVFDPAEEAVVGVGQVPCDVAEVPQAAADARINDRLLLSIDPAK